MLIRNRDPITGRMHKIGVRCNYCESEQIAETVLSPRGRVDLCPTHAKEIVPGAGLDTGRQLSDHIGAKLDRQIEKDGILLSRRKRQKRA